MSNKHLMFVLGAGLALTVAATPAFAGAELIVNGNFETTTVTTSQQMTTTNVSNWSTSGYNFIYLASSSSASGTTADTTGATNRIDSSIVKLWGSGTGVANGLTTSPVGGNFIAADDNYGQGAISQTVNNLIVGATYVLKFYWAAAQQSGYDGVTQEQWTVTFGNQTASTETINLASHGFAAWRQVTMNFVATATSQTLSFLATGSPGGAPPFSLLDGVSLMAVPEPGTWGLVATGVFGLGFMTWYRRRGSSLAGTAQA